MCAKLKQAKKKSGDFGVTYSVKLFYHELDNYFIENER